MDQQPDSSLIELAKGGDQAAFAELYTRYFDPVYDFVARMTRDRDEAADIAQDTFLKAMNALGGLQKGASFKSWIFTIARNTALNRIEKSSRTRPLTFDGEDGEEVGFDVVDTDRFSDPEEAAQASAVSALVWEAAAGLDPKQLSLLDLHLRQGLDSGEIADVLGVTKNNGYVMLNRLKKAVEDSIGAFIMLKSGREYCEDLDFVLSRADIRGMSPEARKVVERHVAECPNCEERKRKLAPLAAFAAFGAIPCPMAAKAHILEGLMNQWPGPVGSGATQSIARHPDGTWPPNNPGGGFFGRREFLKAGAVLGGVAALLLGALFVPASPLALIDDGDDGNQGIIDLPTAPDDEESPSPVPATPTPSNTAGPSSTPSGTAQAGQVSPTAPPTQTNTPAPTPGPGTPTFTPSPTATRTNTPIPTATPTQTATPTSTPTVSPTACVPSLSTSTDLLNIAPGGNSAFNVSNGAGCQTTFSVGAQGAAWLGASGGGTFTFGELPVSVSVNAALVPSAPGTYTGQVLVAWAGGSFQVTVQTERTGVAPVIISVIGNCPAGGGSNWVADVTDDESVASVVVLFTNNDGAPVSVPLSPSGGIAWTGNGSSARGGTNFRAVATDNVGLSTTFSFAAPRTCAS